MPSHNSATLIGHVGKDVEFKALSNTSLASFSLAVSEKRKGTERTDWFRVKLFGKTAEIARDYVNKGDAVLVEGAVHIEEWTDKEKNKRTSVELIGNRLVLLGNKKREEGPAANEFQASDDDVPF